MEAKELRIGNLVYLVRGIREDAIKVEHYDIDHLVNNSKHNKYKPIHLTEQWLIDLGFEKQVLSDNSAHYYTLELNENKYCDLSLCSGDKNGFIEATLFPYEDWFRYKYVHELQNLYFALTGRELEIKNK